MNSRLFQYLSKNGCDVSYLHGATITQIKDYPTYYWALKKKDALRFIKLCEEEIIPIIGGEVYYKYNDGSIEYSSNNWSYDRNGRETWSSYLENSVEKALFYINTIYREDDVLYGFTIDEP